MNDITKNDPIEHHHGRPADRFIIDTGDVVAIAIWNALSGVGTWHAEGTEAFDRELTRLRQLGAKEFRSVRELLLYAYLEKWPGWENSFLTPEDYERYQLMDARKRTLRQAKH